MQSPRCSKEHRGLFLWCPQPVSHEAYGNRKRPPALVQTTLLSEPFSGHIFAFRGRQGDLIKLLWWSGDGLCLFIKRLERGKFVWPQTTTGTVHLTGAQLSMLLEGINWKRPERTWQPQMIV
jgi:transposase